MRSGLSGAVAFALVLAVCVPAQAQRVAPYDSLYLAVPDILKARDWYLKNMGGNAGEVPERVGFGQWLNEHPLPVQLVFVLSSTAQPSKGSVIDSIGFSFRDLDAKMKDLQAEGVKVVAPITDVPGLWKRAVIEDPWGTTLELVQDTDQLGLHHLTSAVPNPDETVAWYVRAFGGDRAKLNGQVDAIRYRDLALFYLIAVKADRAAPSAGHSIDHLGWGPLDLDKVVKDLTAIGVKFVSNPNPRANPACGFLPAGAGDRAAGSSEIRKLSCTQPEQLPHRSVYLESPDGVRIELVQHLEVIGAH